MVIKKCEGGSEVFFFFNRMVREGLTYVKGMLERDLKEIRVESCSYE